MATWALRFTVAAWAFLGVEVVGLLLEVQGERVGLSELSVVLVVVGTLWVPLVIFSTVLAFIASGMTWRHREEVQGFKRALVALGLSLSLVMGATVVSYILYALFPR